MDSVNISDKDRYVLASCLKSLQGDVGLLLRWETELLNATPVHDVVRTALTNAQVIMNILRRIP